MTTTHSIQQVEPELAELRNEHGLTEDEHWAQLPPDLHPQSFFSGYTSTLDTWLALADTHTRAARCGDPRLRGAVELLTLAVADLLTQHNRHPDTQTCAACYRQDRLPAPWPCPTWNIMCSWLVPSQAPEQGEQEAAA